MEAQQTFNLLSLLVSTTKGILAHGSKNVILFMVATRCNITEIHTTILMKILQ